MKFKTQSGKSITIICEEIKSSIELQKKVREQFEADPECLERMLWEFMEDLDIEKTLVDVEEKKK